VRLTVVGNPGNRRVTLFRAAARAAGWDDPTVVSWHDLLRGAPAHIPRGSLVRVDSPGEDAEVDRLLRGAPTAAEHGELVGLSAWYDGLCRALDRIRALVDEAGGQLAQDPDEIAVMFDKRACHRRLADAGVAVPPALPGPASYAELRASMAEAGWTQVFVKPAHGSSASGVLALRAHGRRVRATTAIERSGGKLYNSLRVRDYRDEATIAELVDRLAPDGLHVERWFPKATLAGRVCDLRVLVIGGRPSHVVVRTSRFPMTNLHLGGARGDLAALRAAAGERAYAAALRTCVAAAACFPRSLHVGVDLLFSPDFTRHAVAECNAFGDLLPGLLVDGRDPYAEQAHQLRALAATATLAANRAPVRS